MSDKEADSHPTQNGSQCESTNSIGGTPTFKTVPISSQSNESHYIPSQYNDSIVLADTSFKNQEGVNRFEVDLDIPIQSATCRAEQIMKLVKTGAYEELQQKIITLIEENDRLKIRLNQMNSNCNPLQDTPNIERTNTPEDDFCIDAVPAAFDQSLQENSLTHESGSSINYDIIKGGESLLLSASKSEENGTVRKSEKAFSANCCFNCLGSHLISECKQPRDHQRISKNRRGFQSRQTVTSSRYHIEENQKFSHIQPGQQPSTSLIRALGLKDNRYLPPYVYQMRKLGYPPAWLKYAQINPSGLSLYMARGTKLEEYVSDVNNGEEGEISIMEQSNEEVAYDVDKLVGWPGFNVEPDKNYKEECRRYRAPPLQLDRTSQNFQSLETMKQRLAAHQQKGYVRGEMQNTNVGTGLPDSHANTKECTDPEPPGIGNSINVDESPQLNSHLKPSSVKNTDHGTPIVDTYSPYSILPTSDKWTCFTTDHIFFENLPEATGKYDNISGILKKCRDARKEIETLAGNSKSCSDTTPSGS